MSSEVEICKFALSEIRAGNINSLDETTPQAQQCRLKYPIIRDQLLSGYDFSFNQSIKALATVSDEVFDWDYVYQYPVDCLNIKRVIPDVETTSSYLLETYNDPTLLFQNDVIYRVMMNDGKKVIVSNYPNLRIDYRRSVTDPNLFESNFKMALIYMLAASIAVSIVGVKEGSQLRSSLLELHQYYLNMALVNSANQELTHLADSEFLTVRN